MHKIVQFDFRSAEIQCGKILPSVVFSQKMSCLQIQQPIPKLWIMKDILRRPQSFERSFWCLQFPPKNEGNQVHLRLHSSKEEFVCSFFGGNVGLKKLFQLCLTFRKPQIYQDFNRSEDLWWNTFKTSENWSKHSWNSN